MLLEFDLVHAELRLIDTDDLDLQEWAISIDGCTIEQIYNHIMPDEYPQCSFIHACHTAATLANISHIGDPTAVPIRDKPLRFLPYPRAAVLHDLNKISGGNLHVSDTFATGKMTRTAQFAIDTDRFISINRYKLGEKKGADIIDTPFLMVEIDDDTIPNAVDAATEWAPDLDIQSVLISLAETHVRTAQQALTFLCDEPIPPPFYVCYTGNRSFHMLWRFKNSIDPVTRTNIDMMKRSVLESIRAKFTHNDSESALLTVDPEPMLSAVALVRIPCDVPEWSTKTFKHRHKQIAWHVTDSPTDPNKDTLDSVAMSAKAVAAMISRVSRMSMTNRFVSRTKSERQPLRNVTQEEVERALGKR